MKTFCVFFIVLYAIQSSAQYVFKGTIESDEWNGVAYLSIIEDYRKTSNIYSEQIINKSSIVNHQFQFVGNNLDTKNKIYRIHVDSCTEEENGNHFDGNCSNSRAIIFIANTTDTINFPISLDHQMFCNIQSDNSNSAILFKIDSLKEQMSYDYSVYKSEASRKLNNKKWFTKLQQFGKKSEEPLAELYIYSFLSDRSSDLYSYYLEDLKSNDYYNKLFDRLRSKHPNSLYTQQYEMELTSDKFKISELKSNAFLWKYILFTLLGLSFLVNLFLGYRLKKSKQLQLDSLSNKLTQQEQKILNHILQDKTNKEIASEIFVSLSTVKTHINNIYKKLNIQSRNEVKRLFDR